MKRARSLLPTLILFQIFAASSVSAQVPEPAEPGLCTTCEPLGTCDEPSVRDQYLVDAGSDWLTVRVHVLVYLKTDLSGPTASDADLRRGMDELLADFAPHKIDFVYTVEHIPRATSNSADAVTPWSRVNISITDGLGGQGTFPCDPDRLTEDGGIWLGSDYLVAPWQSLLTHEMGHTTGLWHTFHGVSEVPGCSSPCYERADRRDPDTTGDLCSDTPPTPWNRDCVDPGGSDKCSSTDWGATLPESYMSYGYYNEPTCWTHFTPQQGSRVRCWTLDVLGGLLHDIVVLRGVVVPSAEPLTLYRLLGNGISNAHNALYAVKSATTLDAVELSC